MENINIPKLAGMARIKVADDAKIAESLSGILSYVDQVTSLSGSTNPVSVHQNTAREDVVSPASKETHDLLLASFPEKEGPYLRVPKVL